MNELKNPLFTPPNSGKGWVARFLNLAENIAQWSKDETKVGCVIVRADTHDVVALGYNGFPRGIDDDVKERHYRPAKYSWTEHAERNAIFNAARRGAATDGCTAYIQLFPCTECARALIQSGIKAIVCSSWPDLNHNRWGESWMTSIEMFLEANISIWSPADDFESFYNQYNNCKSDRMGDS